MIEAEKTATRVGYQGVPGAYSEEALVVALPKVEAVSVRTLADLFAALDAGEIDQAFVPVENSHAGSVVEAWDLMVDHDACVLGEWIQPVSHLLLGMPGARVSDIVRVYSHPQALAQTAAYLREAGLDSEPYYDTAGAAQMVAEHQDRRYAAVAGRLAGERYGLTVLADGIQTSADNATRFFFLAPGPWRMERTVQTAAPGKTSLVFSTEHRPGSLVRALSCFSREQVNLSRVESRPSRRKPWEYLFFTDVEGYASDMHVHAALRELTRLNPFVHILGSYPAALEPAETRQTVDGGVA
ncbi:MAG: prephenate dehydratase [Chloroflexota bacterium]|nr:MAG: prephenate dehydratase [Chloroflexota bacterium]